ncbi:MAG: hypothetical protein WBG16_13175 [Bradyrhizobium sp.]
MGTVADFGLDGSLDAERLQAKINRQLDSALLSPWTACLLLRFARGWTFPCFAAPGWARRLPAVTAFTVKRLA